jgi:hypothetical protein
MNLYGFLSVSLVVLVVLVCVWKYHPRIKRKDECSLSVEEFGNKWRIVFRDGLFILPYPEVFNTKEAADDAIPECWNGISNNITRLGGRVNKV